LNSGLVGEKPKLRSLIIYILISCFTYTNKMSIVTECFICTTL